MHTIIHILSKGISIIRSVNPDILKIIALIAMTLDHTATVLGAENILSGDIMRAVGRTAYPIFACLILSHLTHPHITYKYIQRLSIWGLITAALLMPIEHISGIEFRGLNILISFLLPVGTITLMHQVDADMPTPEKSQVYIKNGVKGVIILLMAFLSVFCQYSVFGFIYMLIGYAYFKYRRITMLIAFLTAAATLNLPGIPSAVICIATTALCVSLDPTVKKPRFIHHKHLIYAYYPMHLMILYLIRLGTGG